MSSYPKDSEMAQKNEGFSIQFIIILGFAAIVYMLFIITSSIYTDYKVEKYLLKMKRENEQMAMENRQKNIDLLYYSSPQYRNKYAKQNLDRVAPGEKVIKFADVEENIFYGDPSKEDFTFDIRNLDKPDQWYEYFFGDIENFIDT